MAGTIGPWRLFSVHVHHAAVRVCLRPVVYRIRVDGRLDPRWSARLSGMTIAIREEPGQPPMTELTGPLPDQAALGFCHGYAVGTCHYHTIAQQAGLSQVCLERIETAERVIPQEQVTSEVVSGYVRQQVHGFRPRRHFG